MAKYFYSDECISSKKDAITNRFASAIVSDQLQRTLMLPLANVP